MAGKRDKWYRNLGERTVRRKCRRCGHKFRLEECERHGGNVSERRCAGETGNKRNQPQSSGTWIISKRARHHIHSERNSKSRASRVGSYSR